MKEQLLQGVRLSPLQQRVWSLQNESPVYSQQCVIAITGPLNETQLADCIRNVISRHEVLRTVYRKQASLAFPVQVVREDVSFDWQQDNTINDRNYEEEQPLGATLARKDENSYELLLTMPALAADNFTMQQIASEIAAAYNNSTTETVTIPYTRFSEWQHELLSSPDEFASDFWEKYPYQKGNQYAIPFLHYNTTGGAFDPQRLDITIDHNLLKELKEMETGDVSTANIVMACFYLLLHRLTGLDETTIGYTHKGRDYEELEHTIGLLSKTLPVVIQSRDDLSVITLAQYIVGELEKTREYGEYFSWQNETNEQNYCPSIFEYGEIKDISTKGDVKFHIDAITTVTDKFDIKLNFTQWSDRVKLGLYYDKARLSESSAATLAAQLVALLEEAVKTPHESVKDIMARSIRQYDFAGDVNNASAPGNNIIEVFENTVKNNEQGIAVQFGNKTLTYGELNTKADRLAEYLTKLGGVKKGGIVALCMQRSEDMIVALFGILKSGAAYLPIDPKTPAARINYMLEDSQSVLLITDGVALTTDTKTKRISIDTAFWDNLPDTSLLQLSCCDKCKNRCSNPGEEKACRKKSVDIKPSSIAYVIYTSGSTGKPKGVLISHSSLVNYAHWFISKYEIKKTDRTLLFSSIAFDLCYTTLWSSLLSGAALHIHKESEYLDPVAFTGDLIANKITFIKLTPSHFNLIARDPEFDTKNDKYGLRLIVLGGEEIIAEDVEEYLQYNPAVQFVNHYGPTESTIGILTKNISKENISQFRQKTVLGRSNAGNKVFILDQQARRLCAIGETGEICVSGKGLAAGYLNRRELTAEKFIANPLLDEVLMYRTGDLGRCMPDGNIEFLGRKDFQVKIRGYRIETGEIEQALLDYSGVQDASVQVSQQDGTEEKLLVAFIKSKNKIKNSSLSDHITGKLPHYMIPSSFIVLPSFPLLPNGKLDRKALLEMVGQQSTRKEYVAPRNNTERILANIWQDVLTTGQAGVKDNFFELGGHSLKAAQLVSRIYKVFNKKIELRSVFDSPTIAQLARVIQATGYDRYNPIPQVAEAEYYAVSHAQKRLWILNHFTKDKIPYNSSSFYRIKGVLKIELLEAAFETLIKRHESLRTSFVVIDGTPWQKINTYEACGFRLESADVRNEEYPDRAAEQLTLSGYNTPFDLAKGPLVRSLVIRVRDEEYLLACNIHHIIYDGWSLNILFNELLTIYNSFVENKENPLPPLTVQYKDYSAWHNAMISADEEDYWLQKLSNHPKLIGLPYDKIDRSDELTYSRRNVFVDADNTQALREIAKSYNTTLSNLMLSIYGLFLNQVSGQHDIMVGIGHANRNHEDTEKLIGFFINMLAIRIRFSEDDTLETIVRQVSDNSIEAFQHSNYPFDLLVEKLCVSRYADRQPILNVMYDFKNFYDVFLQEDLSQLETNLEIEQIRLGETLAAHDLILHAIDNEDNIMYYFEYKKDCFLPATIQNFYSIFNKLVGLVIRELSPLATATV